MKNLLLFLFIFCLSVSVFAQNSRIKNQKLEGTYIHREGDFIKKIEFGKKKIKLIEMMGPRPDETEYPVAKLEWNEDHKSGLLVLGPIENQMSPYNLLYFFDYRQYDHARIYQDPMQYDSVETALREAEFTPEVYRDSRHYYEDVVYDDYMGLRTLGDGYEITEEDVYELLEEYKEMLLELPEEKRAYMSQDELGEKLMLRNRMNPFLSKAKFAEARRKYESNSPRIQELLAEIRELMKK